MQKIGTFQSARWGKVAAFRGHYNGPNGPLAVALQTATGEPLATLSVNMYRPECSHDSRDLPAGCFYVKDYGGHEDLAAEALASGLFKVRDDLPNASSGFVSAPAWELVEHASSNACAIQRTRARIDSNVAAASECSNSEGSSPSASSTRAASSIRRLSTASASAHARSRSINRKHRSSASMADLLLGQASVLADQALRHLRNLVACQLRFDVLRTPPLHGELGHG